MKLIILMSSLIFTTEVFAANSLRLDHQIFLRAPAVKNGPALDDWNWGQTKVEATSLWNQGIRGAGVKIGLVDTNMDHQHPQLKAGIAVNTVEADGKPGIDDDQNGYVDDINGWDFIAHQDPITFGVHATHLAGTLVADPGGGQVQGMAPEAKIISAGFIDEQNGGSIADAVLAIEYVIQRGAQVVNMSWGGAAYSQPLYDVIAEHPNVLFVTEAGNDGVDLAQSPDYPASFHLPNLITVGATASTDLYAPWSNSGLQDVHIAAPGVNIISTGLQGGYLAMDGTGTAAPFVTGAAALLWSYNPTASVLQIKQALMAGVEAGPYPVQSRGRLNVARALAHLQAVMQP